MGRRGQLQIAGTEPKIDQRLKDAASIYQGHKMDRMEMTKLEVKHKQELKAVVRDLLEKKELELPPDYQEGTKVVLLRYHSEHGPLEIVYGRKEVVGVRIEKPKKNGIELVDDGDDEDDDAEDLIG